MANNLTGLVRVYHQHQRSSRLSNQNKEKMKIQIKNERKRTFFSNDQLKAKKFFNEKKMKLAIDASFFPLCSSSSMMMIS